MRLGWLHFRTYYISAELNKLRAITAFDKLNTRFSRVLNKERRRNVFSVMQNQSTIHMPGIVVRKDLGIPRFAIPFIAVV